MAIDPRKRQQKLEKRSAKRKAKHHDAAREAAAGLAAQLTAAARWPILHSFATAMLWDRGMGYICLARQSSAGFVAFGMFLVDRWCLGIKDAMSAVVPRSRFDERIMRKIRTESNMQELSPETARKFVESAVAYAGRLGFSPHIDYQTAKLIFGDIDAAQGLGELEFGQDGKPHFMAGPYDSPARCRQILATLARTCGPGGYHYTMPASLADLVKPESLAGREDLVEADDLENW